MTTRTLDVEGMTCQHCAMAVTKALKAVPGVATAVVDLEKAQATVEGDADPAILAQAVTAQGYKAAVRVA